MSTGLFLASLEERIKDLDRAARRVRQSLSILKHQDSSYAQDHRALLAAYDEALAVFRRHRDEATNAHPVVLEEPAGPLCPVCCRPSWPMSENGKLWRCSKPECMVSSFVISDSLPNWEAAETLAAAQEIDHLGLNVQVTGPPFFHEIGDRRVLSMRGAQALFSDPNPPEEPSHG